MMRTMSVLLTYMLWALEGGKGQRHARTGTRTLDPQIKSLMLYRLSYPGSQTLSHLAATDLPITRSRYTLYILKGRPDEALACGTICEHKKAAGIMSKAH